MELFITHSTVQVIFAKRVQTPRATLLLVLSLSLSETAGSV